MVAWGWTSDPNFAVAFPFIRKLRLSIQQGKHNDKRITAYDWRVEAETLFNWDNSLNMHTSTECEGMYTFTLNFTAVEGEHSFWICEWWLRKQKMWILFSVWPSYIALFKTKCIKYFLHTPGFQCLSSHDYRDLKKEMNLNEFGLPFHVYAFQNLCKMSAGNWLYNFSSAAHKIT